MPTGKFEDLSEYQKHYDGVKVEHQGEAYFLKCFDDMGYKLKFNEAGTGVELIASGKKTYATTEPYNSRNDAMSDILDCIHNDGYEKHVNVEVIE